MSYFTPSCATIVTRNCDHFSPGQSMVEDGHTRRPLRLWPVFIIAVAVGTRSRSQRHKITRCPPVAGHIWCLAKTTPLCESGPCVYEEAADWGEARRRRLMKERVGHSADICIPRPGLKISGCNPQYLPPSGQMIGGTVLLYLGDSKPRQIPANRSTVCP